MTKLCTLFISTVILTSTAFALPFNKSVTLHSSNHSWNYVNDFYPGCTHVEVTWNQELDSDNSTAESDLDVVFFAGTEVIGSATYKYDVKRNQNFKNSNLKSLTAFQRPVQTRTERIILDEENGLQFTLSRDRR